MLDSADPWMGDAAHVFVNIRQRSGPSDFVTSRELRHHGVKTALMLATYPQLFCFGYKS